MAIIDIVLLLILLGAIVSGFSFGLIRTVGSFVGTVAGIYLASQWYIKVAQYLLPIFFGRVNLAKVICFLLVMILVDVVVTLIFYIIHKFIGWLPIIKGINNFGGAVFGFLKGALFIAILAYVISLFPIWPFLVHQMENSFLAPYLINLIAKVVPFLPRAVDGVKSLL